MNLFSGTPIKFRFLILSLALGLTSSVFALASDVTDCREYLRKLDDQNRVGIMRTESLFGKNYQVLDVSEVVRERKSPTQPGVKLFKLSDVFEDGRMFFGFGRPNVYMAFPDATKDVLKNGVREVGFSKFAAKSFKRADSKIEDTRGWAQSGLLVVFKDLPSEVMDQTFEVAKDHEGSREITCVNANCKLMQAAGFTVGGQAMESYKLPVTLLKDILEHGIQYKGQPVAFDLIKTKADYLEDVGVDINKAVAGTLSRHAAGPIENLKKKIGYDTWIVRIKSGTTRALALVYTKKPAAQTAADDSATTASAPAKRVKPFIEKRLDVADDTPTVNYDLKVSEPSKFGTLLRWMWGPHSLYEMDLPAVAKDRLDSLLPKVQKAFPQANPNFVTKLKKNLLFSKPVVSFIRKSLASDYSAFPQVNEKDLFGMLRSDTPQNRNVYNVVITGNKLIIMRTTVKMKKVDWVLSKHVLASGYSGDVRFAGELWKDANGVIHISNNSGTYQPSGAECENAQAYLTSIFPNVDFHADPLSM